MAYKSAATSFMGEMVDVNLNYSKAQPVNCQYSSNNYLNWKASTALHTIYLDDRLWPTDNMCY